MKKKIFIALALMATPYLLGKAGCIDNSWHLKKAYDSKEYHYVACNCPCTKTVADRNKCIDCEHYHLPEALPLSPVSKKSTAIKINQALLSKARSQQS